MYRSSCWFSSGSSGLESPEAACSTGARNSLVAGDLRLDRVGKRERGLGPFLKIGGELGNCLRQTDGVPSIFELELGYAHDQIQRDVLQIDQFIYKRGLERDLCSALSIEVDPVVGDPAETFLQIDHPDAGLRLPFAIGPQEFQRESVLLGFGDDFAPRCVGEGHFLDRVEWQSTKALGGLQHDDATDLGLNRFTGGRLSGRSGGHATGDRHDRARELAL